jgi:hypothetical protein
MWMAGGGIKAGARIGETDELGFNVVRRCEFFLFEGFRFEAPGANGDMPRIDRRIKDEDKESDSRRWMSLLYSLFDEDRMLAPRLLARRFGTE